jgi:hypothetical protein
VLPFVLFLTKEIVMKKLVEVDGDSGFEAAIGEKIHVWCMRYNYAGKLAGVSEDTLFLDDAKLVFLTGKLDDDTWEDAETPLNSSLQVMKQSVESWAVIK